MVSALSVLTLLAISPVCRNHKDNDGKKKSQAQVARQSTLGNIVLYSDNIETIAKWRSVISKATGMRVYVYDFYGHKARTRQAVEHFTQNNKLDQLKPKAVFLQIGCDETPDATDNYQDSLFDFPTGEVCTLSGAMKRNKRMAVSKKDTDINPANFAGAAYHIIKAIRKAHRDARVFFLPPTTPDKKTNPQTEQQLKKMANMFCVPYIESEKQLQDFDFLWKGIKPKLGKMLILGDSYCEQRRWINSLEKMAQVEVTNLGITSASMRDHFNDRKAYPYADNPVRTDCNGNRNTLACQLIKLHRILSGKNLLKGETSLLGYQPDIILVEGGGNDFADEPEVEAEYENHIKNDVRTSFAGALAHLTTDLHNTFPNAKIYIVVSAGLYYGHTDNPFDYMEKARQQRKAADMLGYPTVNWDLDGRLSFIFNNSAGTGDGSEQKPFRYNVPTDETIDLLHPNDYGAQFLAESAVRWLTR